MVLKAVLSWKTGFPGDWRPLFQYDGRVDGTGFKGKQGRELWKLTGRRLYSRKNKCRTLSSRKTTFQIITSRLHLNRDAQTMKKTHPVTQQSAGCQSNSHFLFLFVLLIQRMTS